MRYKKANAKIKDTMKPEKKNTGVAHSYKYFGVIL
jgi:hypothetical protein